MFEIINKVSLVTGGASGIGFAVCRQLLNNGARGVTIADVNEESGKEALKTLSAEFGADKIIFIRTNVAKKEEYEAAFQKTLAEFGNIDILVNNAGILDDKDYEKEIAINFTGSVHGIDLGIKYISKYRSKPEGVIINTSSIAIMGTEYTTACPLYGGIKLGIAAITKALGAKIHYDQTKIKILAIGPGKTETNILPSIVNTFNETCQSVMNRLVEINVSQT